MKKNIVIFISLSLSLVVISCASQKDVKPANVNSAKMIMTVGDVTVGNGKEWKSAQVDMPLTEGQEVKTGESSQCNIVIGNDSYITVKEKSHIFLASLFKDSAGTENTSIELRVGKTVVNPRKLLKSDEFQVKTPTAIAAVRGTQFTVDTSKGKMKIAVVSGKIELKRRVPALEKLDKTVIKKSDALTTLQKKVDEEAVVIDSNQTALLDSKKVQEENRVIEKVVKKHVEIIKEKEAETGKNAVEKPVASEKHAIESKIKEQELKKELAKLDIMKEEKRRTSHDKKVINIKKKVSREDAQAVKELETVKKEEIKKQKIKIEKKAPVITELTIVSPVKGSAISVNGRLLGYNSVTIKPEPGAELSLKVSARGYETFETRVSVEEGKSKILKATMIPGATLAVVTPVRRAAVYINGRFAGRGKVTVSPKPGSTVTVDVKARGYKNYTNRVLIHRGKAQSLNVIMEKDRELSRVAWSERVGRSIKTAPLFVGSKVVVTTVDGYVVAMTREGRTIWRKSLRKSIESSPVVLGSNILVTNTSGTLYALSLSTGAVKWKKNLYGTLLFGSKPVVVNNDLYMATSYGRIYKISSAGKILWENDLENGIYSSPSYSNGTLYIGAEDHRVYAISAFNGRIKWEVKLDGRMVSATPVVKDSVLYLGSYKGTLFAVNIFIGKIKWKYHTGDAIVSSAVISGNSVFIGSSDGNVYSLNKYSGTLKWKKHTGSKVLTTPFFHRKTLYVASGRNLMAMAADSGEVQWKHTFDQAILSSPTHSGNSIYVGLANGEVSSVRISLKDLVK